MIDLDDLGLIAKVDKSNMKEIIYNFPLQCEEAINMGRNFPIDFEGFKEVFVLGMGGSAIGGDILRSYFKEKAKFPVFVNRTYSTPKFINQESLVFTCSYSGNTEEVLSAFQTAMEAKGKVIAITSGGELEKSCLEKGVPVLKLPSGMPPRTALGYLFFPILMILKRFLANEKEIDEEISETLTILKELRSSLSPASATKDNLSKKLAGEVYGKIPIIYGVEGVTEAISFRWKTQVNENAKSPAYNQNFSELNHNEIVGWEGLSEIARRFCILILRDSGEGKRNAKRIDITKSLIKDDVGGIIEVSSQGKGLLARLFSLIFIGDWMSFYLAILYGVDPTPVKRIEKLKKLLEEL